MSILDGKQRIYLDGIPYNIQNPPHAEAPWSENDHFLAALAADSDMISTEVAALEAALALGTQTPGDLAVWTTPSTLSSIAFPSSSSASPVTVEVNCGSMATSEFYQTFTDSKCTPSSNIVAAISGQTPTGKDQDELTMDEILVRVFPMAGAVQIYLRGLEGSIAGTFRVTYEGY